MAACGDGPAVFLVDGLFHMSQNSIIAFALLVGFIVFVTMKGELPQYLAVVGLAGGSAASSTSSTSSTSGTAGTAATPSASSSLSLPSLPSLGGYA